MATILVSDYTNYVPTNGYADTIYVTNLYVTNLFTTAKDFYTTNVMSTAWVTNTVTPRETAKTDTMMSWLIPTILCVIAVQTVAKYIPLIKRTGNRKAVKHVPVTLWVMKESNDSTLYCKVDPMKFQINATYSDSTIRIPKSIVKKVKKYTDGHHVCHLPEQFVKANAIS